MIWKGHISFGLVNIPVALHPAVTRDELDFTLLDKRDLSPIGYRKVNKRTGDEVPANRITRGLAQQKGRFVIVSDEDLRRASPERTRRIDILSFADLRDIDPIHYDHPYYLAPRDRSEKGYVLLREALRRSGRIAVATVVIRTRQYLATVAVHGAVLVLLLLRYASELRDSKALGVPPSNSKSVRITDKEIRAAEQLIQDMTEPWDPTKYRDEYRHELMTFIRKRARSGRTEEVPEPSAPKPGKGEVIDLMELLKRSVERRGRAAAGKRRAGPKVRRTA
jgi:DNA end-binding protein Ku